MPSTSNVQTDFRGGIWSPSAQGRMDDPRYRIALNECLNGFPVQAGAWVRRPAFRSTAFTKHAGRAKLKTFSLDRSPSHLMELTEENIRFLQGPNVLLHGTRVDVLTISSASPAVVTATAHGLATGDSIFIFLDEISPSKDMNDLAPLISRIFDVTVLTADTFSIADALGNAISGAGIDISDVTVRFSRVYDLTSPYEDAFLDDVKHVQTGDGKNIVLLHEKVPLQSIDIERDSVEHPQFTIAPAKLVDGPYLDPVSGTRLTPTARTGIIGIKFSFDPFDATKSYSEGDYVTSAGAPAYRSLTDGNVNNAPVSSTAEWEPVELFEFVNGGQGFTEGDIGRHIRLFSEPAAWEEDLENTYLKNDLVTHKGVQWTALRDMNDPTIQMAVTIAPLSGFTSEAVFTRSNHRFEAGNRVIIRTKDTDPISVIPTGLTDGATYFVLESLISTSSFLVSETDEGPPVEISDGGTGEFTVARLLGEGRPNEPGNAPDTWAVTAGVARWTWGRIHSLEGGATTPTVLAVSSIFGDFHTSNAAIFDDDLTTEAFALGTTARVGHALALGKTVASGIYYPSFRFARNGFPSGWQVLGVRTPFADDRPTKHAAIIELWAKTGSAPSSSTDGTKLGFSGPHKWEKMPALIKVMSNDRTTEFDHVWFRVIASPQQMLAETENVSSPPPYMGVSSGSFQAGGGQYAVYCREAIFYETDFASWDIEVEIVGDPLLYSSTFIKTWRLGRFNQTEPTNPISGCYHQGRLFLASGENHFDTSIAGKSFVFSPTEIDGTVTDGSAISYDLLSKTKNNIFWMQPGHEGILCGTDGGQWLISSGGEAIFAPTTVKAEPQSSFGCADIEPVDAGLVNVFVHKNLRAMHEFFRDAYSGELTAPTLQEFSPDLTVGGLSELAYTQALTPIVWAVTATGVLLGTTYKRENLLSQQPPSFNGWHRHSHGNTSRIFTSIAATAGIEGNNDTLAVVTKDKSTGFYRVEFMVPLMGETDDALLANFLDGTQPSVAMIPEPEEIIIG